MRSAVAAGPHRDGKSPLFLSAVVYAGRPLGGHGVLPHENPRRDAFPGDAEGAHDGFLGLKVETRANCSQSARSSAVTEAGVWIRTVA